MPVYRPMDRRIRFAVYRAGRHVKDYDYTSDAHIFVGWLSLLALPWSESRELQASLVNITHQFITDAARDGILRQDSGRSL